MKSLVTDNSKPTIPYGRQWIGEEDIDAVVEVLRSNWLTTGPNVDRFEEDFAATVGTQHAVAVSSGTAALHCAIHALDVGPGDEVIVPAMTFAATANCIVYQGGKPVIVDVEEDTLLIDPVAVEAAITPRTKGIIAVDYAGYPCDYDRLQEIADRHGVTLLSDACHSLGAAYRGRPVGNLAKVSCFSFHPVKPMTTGEGGMMATDDPDLAKRMRVFRNHGITTDHFQRAQRGTWFYEMHELGFNYRLSDIHCALGISQLRKLADWTQRRQQIAERYDRAFREMDFVDPLFVRTDVSHAYHLYVIRCKQYDRGDVFGQLRGRGIGVNVHYLPVHLHPFYRERFGTQPGMCPVAEAAYDEILSLPIFPAMNDDDVDSVINAVATTFSDMITQAA